ncbi:MAG TPA: phosphoribosyltransferase family protein [Candidatus Lustribacter sp.]|nr:phosphoribosyltransferase family protein [Candidatus Lustribacter sp.]
MWTAIRPWLFPVWCIGCGVPDTGLCPACCASARSSTVVLDQLPVRAAGDYAGAVRDAILAVKRGERACLDPLAALLAPLVPAGTVLVPLTTTRRRAAERGFDQARELARRVALRAGGTCADIVRKHGSAQRGLGRNERLVARGRFAFRPGVTIPPRVMLLDDVMTTGATLRDAAALLASAGCSVAGAVVVARTLPGRETPRRGGRLVEA